MIHPQDLNESPQISRPFCKFTNKVTGFSYIADRLVAKLAEWKTKKPLPYWTNNLDMGSGFEHSILCDASFSSPYGIV